MLNRKSWASYHGTVNVKAKVTPSWDKERINVYDFKIINKLSFKEKLEFMEFSRKKSQEINRLIKVADPSIDLDTNELLKSMAHKSFLISQDTFRMALKHDCFYDIIKNENGILTIAFLPFSTSSNKVLCGHQQFENFFIKLDIKKKWL